MESEVFRSVEGFCEGEVTCPRCGTSFRLYFNGGELDGTECCGINFRTEATGYRLVMSPAT
jgi:hypothetical protein